MKNPKGRIVGYVVKHKDTNTGWHYCDRREACGPASPRKVFATRTEAQELLPGITGRRKVFAVVRRPKGRIVGYCVKCYWLSGGQECFDGYRRDVSAGNLATPREVFDTREAALKVAAWCPFIPKIGGRKVCRIVRRLAPEKFIVTFTVTLRKPLISRADALDDLLRGCLRARPWGSL